jgi:hypothetical protein
MDKEGQANARHTPDRTGQDPAACGGLKPFSVSQGSKRLNAVSILHGVIVPVVMFAKVSLALIGLRMALAFIEPLLIYGAYALVSLMWFIPDRRFATSGVKQEG